MDIVLWGMVRKDSKEPAAGLSAPDAKRAWATLHHVWNSSRRLSPSPRV
jgi:hypothetical protein